MLRKLVKTIGQLYDKRIDGSGLAIFRIAFSLVLLGEVLQLFYFRHLIFDKVPYLVPGEITMWPVFLFWILAILFVVFGLFTRIASIINYILTVIVLGAISSFEYHMFYSYLIINFLFIFLPISRKFSLDRLLLKLKYSNTRFRYNPPEAVSVLSYHVPVLLGIGFVYFDSVFFKFDSYLWLHGLGFWLPSSMPQAVFINISPFLNLKYIVLGLGYLALIFEAIFLFTFWRKKWRLPILIIGMGLHLGILVCFPIPFFGLGVLAIYLLMIPVACWRRIFRSKGNPQIRVKFYYDGECPLCNRTVITLSHFNSRGNIDFLTVQENAASEPALKNVPLENLLNDIYAVDLAGKVYAGLNTYIRVFKTIWYLKPLSWILRLPGIYDMAKRLYRFIAINRSTERCTENNCGHVPPSLPPDNDRIKILVNVTLRDVKIKAIFYAFIILSALQIAITYNSPLIGDLKEAVGISNNKIVKISEYISEDIQSITKVLLGVTHHGLFVDSHFQGYNHSIAIIYRKEDGKEVWLPITNVDGTGGSYLWGFNWAKWTFRVNAPLIDREKLFDGIKEFTAFWAYKNGIDLQNAVFEVKVKKNKVPLRWEYDFLNKQLQNPWMDAGKVVWRDNHFSPYLKVIEKM